MRAILYLLLVLWLAQPAMAEPLPDGVSIAFEPSLTHWMSAQKVTIGVEIKNATHEAWSLVMFECTGWDGETPVAVNQSGANKLDPMATIHASVNLFDFQTPPKTVTCRLLFGFH